MQLLTYKIQIFSLIFTAILLSACNSVPKKNGVWKDKNIPAEKAAELREMTTNLFKAINRDRDEAELLFSKDFLQQKNIKVQFDYVNKLRREGDYYLYRDCYIVNKGDPEDSPGALSKVDDPELNYQPLAKEMYIAFFVPKKKRNKIMITVVYGKYDIGWKANHIAMGYYTHQGKTANQLLEIAKHDYAKGYLVTQSTISYWPPTAYHQASI